ncbi:MAG: ATP-binding protein, partial [Gemmatimonadota bacterium]
LETLALTQLRPDVPAASVLAILDSLGTPTTAIPDLAASKPIGQAVPVRAIARVQGQAPVAILPIPNDTSRMVIHAASCVAGACRGGVAAIITAERLLQRAANELSGDWTIAIGAPRAAPPSSSTSLQVVPLNIGSINWILIARPTPATVGALRSTLPEVALILGLIVSGLLSVTVRLGDRAFRGARMMERMQLQSALDRNTDALWEWDVTSGALDRSPELWRYMGFNPTTMKHTLDEWLELVHPDDRERVAGELWSQVEHDRATFETEYRLATPAGDWHQIVDRGRAVERDAEGRAVRVLGISADVTKARRREQEFREVEALTSMGRVAARVAHEINNPLAGIRSAFLLIKDAVPEDHPHHRYVGAIEREVDRIATVTRGLYETYRPEREGSTTAVSSVIGDAVALLGEMNRKAQVTIETNLTDIPPVVAIRGALLRQIVYNLVQNAIDASPPGGVVTMSGRMNGRGMILEVSDQGSGVPIGLRDRVFEPFFTTKGSNAENSGMGLGLSMVSRSVTAAGGTISVGDNAVGGAIFRVVLPIDHPVNEDMQS